MEEKNACRTVCPCDEQCPLGDALSLIGGKWKMRILCEGSTLKSTFANSLTLFMAEATGIMKNQKKTLCIIPGFRIISMWRTPRSCRKQWAARRF